LAYPERFTPELTEAVRRGLDAPTLRATLSPAIAEVLDDRRVGRAARFVLTGSGDSLFAATAARPALRRWVGRPVDVLTALELGRYETPLLGPGDVVLGVSNSGGSARTRESLTLARERGALTVAVVGSRTGPLAGLAERVLHRPVEAPQGLDAARARVYLNLIEYVATLATLYGLGLELGVQGGALARAEAIAWGDRLDAAIAVIGAVAGHVEPAVAALARELEGADTVWVLGGGPNRGTADYAAAKFHEQGPVNGIAQDLEEWAHLQYFLTLAWKARSVVVVLAPPGNALDRAEELVAGIAGAGGRAIVVGHPRHGRFPGAHARLDVAADTPELLTPLLYHVPVQLLVLHLARLAGVPHVPLRRQDDYWLIRGGLVRPTGTDLS
jgi:glucosamine--fructose-6-phosphate aminotransferase (isomerizing)